MLTIKAHLRCFEVASDLKNQFGQEYDGVGCPGDCISLLAGRFRCGIRTSKLYCTETGCIWGCCSCCNRFESGQI